MANKKNGVVNQINLRFDDLKEHISLELKPIKEEQDRQRKNIDKNTKFRHQMYAIIGSLAGLGSLWAGAKIILKKILGG